MHQLCIQYILTTISQKRKRREYTRQRKDAFTRPEPGFSLYEGRTRGKRQRYTFDEEDDFDSDSLSVRRSGRQSGRDTPAAPSGPTVTASGRQVRSRATGLYGEKLHSGQVADHPSPATGDYIRSDMSEEPQSGHGRATRAANRGTANRGTANGRTLNRTLDSDDDEDATSWDGGDDEEEPDQMDLDDDEDDGAADDSEDDDDDEPSLMVTLRYRKPGSDAQDNDMTMVNGSAHDATQVSEVPPPKPLQQDNMSARDPSASTVQPEIPSATNGLSSLKLSDAAPVTNAQQPPVANPDLASKPDSGFFSAPTPPYSAPEEAPKSQAPSDQSPMNVEVPATQ
jgi:hypothetical protein